MIVVWLDRRALALGIVVAESSFRICRSGCEAPSACPQGSGEWQRAPKQHEQQDGRRGCGQSGPNSVKLSEADIQTAGIELTEAQSGTIARRIVAPGSIVPHADRIAKVSVRLSGTVAELRKKIGDPVAKDEVLAILGKPRGRRRQERISCGPADERAAAGAVRARQGLWDKHVATEQQYLRSRNRPRRPRCGWTSPVRSCSRSASMATEIADLDQRARSQRCAGRRCARR